MKIMNCKNEKETLHASETSFDAYKLYSKYLNDKACVIIFPSEHSMCQEILLKNDAC